MKARALDRGTVKLSSPKGETLSAKVATNDAARTAKRASKNGKEYRIEKKTKPIDRLRKLIRNIANVPSRLLFAKTLYLLLPCFSPITEAAASPYAIGKIPAAMMKGLPLKTKAKTLYEMA